MVVGVAEELRGRLWPGLPELVARVDLLIDAGDALAVTDFKTARSQWGAEQVGEWAWQLILCQELARGRAGGRPVRLAFAVLSKTKAPELVLHPIEADAQQVERAKRVVDRVWQAIQGGHFYPNPSPLNCPTCPYREPCVAWTG
jgi:CRISPR/Cas system-associated exonuclease Cas4 (RecB family)